MDKKAVMQVCVALSFMAGSLRTAAGTADLGGTERVSLSSGCLKGRAAELVECVQTLLKAIDADEPTEGGA